MVICYCVYTDTGTSLQDLISGLKLSWTSLLQSEECDPEAEEVEEKDAEKEDNDETKEEIDTLTKGGEESHLVPAVAPSKPPSEWAVKVNLKETIDDFHYRVPNMAHKVINMHCFMHHYLRFSGRLS